MEHGKTRSFVYIDLSKVFDRLSFDIILYKLNYYGIAGRPTELQLLTNYLKTENSMLFLLIMNLILLKLQRVSHRVLFLALCCSA